MTTLDYVVLAAYFLAMAGIGILCMLKVKKQEDFFLGGRSFGRVLQAFAAFGAGTGSNDPVTLGRTVYTSGLSGIWSVLLWLFVTPFYWIFGVWYRRMRHLTLGDWFVERYESRTMGLAYTLFAIVFYMMYLSVGFSAIGKVAAPLVGVESFRLPWLSAQPVPIETVLVPIVALFVAIYGVLGGLRAAYWTDLVQGVFIILLSVILIPYGLEALVARYGDPATMSAVDGFRLMHEQVPADYFEIVESPTGGEFPLHYIVAITLINLVGIVVQPHFIATGGGSAKTENSARVGLVVGNFMKRFCTVGWALTALVVLALVADDLAVAEDPDRVWGVAAREILGPLNLGLVGLMLACLLAALMSSADCYMLVSSALVVRNFYVPFLRPDASEKEGLLVGRITSGIIILGATIISLKYLNVFEQLKVTWEMPIIFAAPFWIGMFWRRATTRAAWLTCLYSLTMFFVIPIAAPKVFPRLATSPSFAATNRIVETIVTRPAAGADVSKREAQIRLWEQRLDRAEAMTDPVARDKALDNLGPRPEPVVLGEPIEDVFRTGGRPIFWSGSVEKIDQSGKVVPFGEGDIVEISREQVGRTTTVVKGYHCRLRGNGYLNLDLLLYDLVGLDLTAMTSPTLETLRLPARVITPFLVMIVLSLFTMPNHPMALGRYYVKMQTPVEPDPDDDLAELERSYHHPMRFDERKLFPGTSIEIQRPTLADVVGFVLSFIACLSVMAVAVWVAKIGS